MTVYLNAGIGNPCVRAPVQLVPVHIPGSCDREGDGAHVAARVHREGVQLPFHIQVYLRIEACGDDVVSADVLGLWDEPEQLVEEPAPVFNEPEQLVEEQPREAPCPG